MADQIRVSFSGLSDALTAIDELKVQIDAATQRATEQAGNQLINYAKANFVGSHPPGWPHVGGSGPNVVTGNLKRSIRSQPIVKMGPGRYSVRVGPTAIYGRIIELGGTITPKNGEFLSWISGQTGRRVFVRSVTIRPHPYFTPAYESTKAKMGEIFQAAWRKALNHGG